MFVHHLSNNSAVVGVYIDWSYCMEHGIILNLQRLFVEFTAVIRCIIQCNHNGQRKVQYSSLSSPFLKVC
jgi:hypothetical protein